MTSFRAAGRLFAAAVSTLQAALAPWLDLAIRVWLAQAFLVLQVRAVMLGGTSSHLTAPLGAGWWLDAAHNIMASSLGLAI